jgi:ABC-2 type transport system permease protein
MNVKRVIVLEGILVLRSRAWWTVALLLALLIGFATLHSAGEHERAVENRTAMMLEEIERLASLNSLAVQVDQGKATAPSWRDPTNPEVSGRRLGFRYAAKPFLPFGFAVVGQGDLQAEMLRVSTQPVEEWAYANEWQNPHRLFFGRFDLGFVLTFLLPLAVIVLASGVLSDEKERGILPLIRSQGPSLRVWASLKLGLRWMLLTGWVGLLLVFFIGLQVDWNAFPFGLVVIDFLWMIGLVAIYLLAWFLVAGVVVSWQGPVALSLGWLLTVWLGLLVILPAGLNLMVDTGTGGPGRYTYADQLRKSSQEVEEEGGRVLDQFYHDHPELSGGGGAAGLAEYGTLRTALMLEVERRLSGLASGYRENRAKRELVTARIGWVVFPLHFQRGLMDLAGTGPERHEHFLSEVSRYHRIYRTFFFERVVRGDSFVAYHRIPTFAYRDERLAQRWDRLWRGGVGIIALPLCLWAGRWGRWRQ